MTTRKLNKKQSDYHVLLSCEHAGNVIPASMRYMRIPKKILNSHLGYDIGAGHLAKVVAHHLQSPLHFNQMSRLLMDFNRSIDAKGFLSDFSRERLKPNDYRKLLRSYEFYRRSIQSQISEKKTTQPVLHLSIHSFTPVLNDKVRTADIGLLFDPKRKQEKQLAEKIRTWFMKNAKQLTVKMNYPYKGTSDGLTTSLRKQFADRDYAGIEIEINQKWFSNARKRSFIEKTMMLALSESLGYATINKGSKP